MIQIFFKIALSFSALPLFAAEGLRLQAQAPVFVATTHDNKPFSLAGRRGQWTVLYFYPKADTPGCTKQACAFRDKIELIRSQGAEVFGVSTDSVEALGKFHEKHKLNFPLLADPEAKVTELYGAKMPFLKIAKRWTFIIDPDLKIRAIEKDVDPAKDAEKVAQKILELK
jgi:peroxiredoxin Q/BCP